MTLSKVHRYHKDNSSSQEAGTALDSETVRADRVTRSTASTEITGTCVSGSVARTKDLYKIESCKTDYNVVHVHKHVRHSKNLKKNNINRF